MKVFAKKLERLISLNRIEQAVDSLLDSISDFSPNETLAQEESKQLRNQVITLSQRLHQANDNLNKGVSSDEDVSRERRSVSSTLLDLIGDFNRYPAFTSFLQEREDELAWKAASRKNTITAYQEYFEHFPNGKYKAQTADLIHELQEVERRRSEEMKHIAEEEKRRRSKQQDRRTQSKAYSKPPDPDYTRERVRSNTESTTQSAPRRPAYGGPLDAEAPEKIKWQTSYLIAAYIGTVLIALLGIGVGIYLRVAKSNGDYKFDDFTRSHGLYLIIFGVVVWIITFNTIYGGF